jgi:hypothetical protein
MANEMFEEAMKDVKVGKSNQVVPLSLPVCVCADCIQEKEDI